MHDLEIIGTPTTTPRVVDVDYPGGHKLHLWFDNGHEGIADFNPLMDDPIYSQLKKESDFIAFGLERGTIVWSKDIDISPEALYEMAKH